MRHIGAAASAAVMLIALAACGQQPASGHARYAHVKTTSATHRGRRDVASGVVQLTGSRSGVIGLALPDPPLRPGRAVQLAATGNDGQSFRLIGPLQSRNDFPDSVFFLSPHVGWLASYNAARFTETLYRTSNGGRTWQAFPAPVHATAAGSQDVVDFVSRWLGWLADIQPTAPREEVERSTDGGARWHCMASTLRHESGCAGTLPELGSVVFSAGGRTGWLGGGLFSPALYRSRDGGTRWTRMAIAAPKGAVFGLPAVLAQTIVENVSVPASHDEDLITFISTDNGARWRKIAEADDVATGSLCLGSMSTSFPTAGAGWAAAFRRGRAVVYRTAGKSRWVAVSAPAAEPHGSNCFGPQILAASAADAWLVIPRDGGDLIYATTDRGRAWHRIDPAAAARR
jgi:photosystem II stability/assembly factor-like uncharacterized protein